MPEYVRVKDKATGHEYTIRADRFNKAAHTKATDPALDNHGDPAAPKYAGQQVQSDVAAYDEMTAANLKAEIERRNTDRESTARLALSGTKPELVARLEDDDNSHTGHAGEEYGHQAETDKENS